jgi:hypothetical protein
MNIAIDLDINQWAKDYDPITINKILKIGYFMYSEFNFDIHPLENQFNSIKSDISVYNENLADLKSSIDTLRGISKSSSSKGKLMENYVEHVIKDNFPDDNLDIVSGTGHESDMHLHFNNTVGGGPDNSLQSILVEVKAYTDTVNTKEVEPTASPVTTPLGEIVAINGLPPVQVPPVDGVKLIFAPTHT